MKKFVFCIWFFMFLSGCEEARPQKPSFWGQERCEQAGLEVIEVRSNGVAYVRDRVHGMCYLASAVHYGVSFAGPIPCTDLVK